MAGGNFGEFTVIRFWRKKVWRICLASLYWMKRFGGFQFGEMPFVCQICQTLLPLNFPAIRYRIKLKIFYK